MLLAALLFTTPVCHASWFIYHKPEFKGRVVDIDTGQPIEGAVVIAFYNKETFSPPIEPRTSTIHAREALTDKAGYFRIPSYTTLIQPFSWSGDVMFLIFKPGYLCFGSTVIEDMFTGKDNEIVDRSPIWNNKLKYRYAASGTIMLPKISSYNDRFRSLLNLSVSEFYHLLPISKKLEENERNYLDTIRGK